MTHQADLREHLTKGLFEFGRDPEFDEIRAAPKLSVISVPYSEGTRALWHPITLGHEAAHIRLEKTASHAARRALTRAWIPEGNQALEAHWLERLNETPEAAPPRVDLTGVLERWVEEILCDLNAVRRFGPAGLSAIAEFLAVLSPAQQAGVGEPSGPVRKAHQTHPPLGVRLEAMFAYLEELGFKNGNLPEHAAVWRDFGAAHEPDFPVEVTFLTDVVGRSEHRTQLINHVRSWGPEYSAERLAAFDWVKNELLQGVPGGTHRPKNASSASVSVEDVVNGVWAARMALDQEGAPDDEADFVTLFSLPDEGDRRIRVDKLASKAIDSVELARLWEAAQATVGSNSDEAVEAHANAVIAPDAGDIVAWAAQAEFDRETVGSILSRNLIASRMRSPERRQRVVVTPLFRDSVQDARIDLRLGPDFIVFRHSATAAFDPLAADPADLDPRRLQERVYKAWGESFILHPGELVLAATLEYVVLPVDISAQVVTRSSYGRLGLITATAVQIQPGSRGCITLELVNHGETPIKLSPGARVGQLVLFSVGAPSNVHRGKYWFPVGPEFSKVDSDPDASLLRGIALKGGEFGAFIDPEAFIFKGVGSHPAMFAEAATAHRVAADPHLDTMVVGEGDIDLLAASAVRFTQGVHKSLRISDSGERIEMVVTELTPRETVEVVDKDRRVVDVVPPGGHIAEVADAIARVLGRRGR